MFQTSPHSARLLFGTIEDRLCIAKIVSDQEFTRLFSGCLGSLHCELVILHMFSRCEGNE